MPKAPKATGAEGGSYKSGCYPVHGPTTKVPTPTGRTVQTGTGIGGPKGSK